MIAAAIEEQQVFEIVREPAAIAVGFIGAPWSPAIRSESASSTLDTTNTTWITTSHAISRFETVLSDMNCFSKCIAEIATIDDKSFNLSAVKSIVPITRANPYGGYGRFWKRNSRTRKRSQL